MRRLTDRLQGLWLNPRVRLGVWVAVAVLLAVATCGGVAAAGISLARLSHGASYHSASFRDGALTAALALVAAMIVFDEILKRLEPLRDRAFPDPVPQPETPVEQRRRELDEALLLRTRLEVKRIRLMIRNERRGFD
jgi:hypothetical protein